MIYGNRFSGKKKPLVVILKNVKQQQGGCMKKKGTRTGFDPMTTCAHCIVLYWLTTWSRVLLKKLRVRSASQEIPRILRNPKVHYRVPRARHPSLSWAQWIQSTFPNPISLRSILMLSSQYCIDLQYETKDIMNTCIVRNWTCSR
jgi:hypothetical protein